MESDAAMTEDLIAYNIIPLDSPTTTNAIVSLPEVSGLLRLISGPCFIFGGNPFHLNLSSGSSFSFSFEVL